MPASDKPKAKHKVTKSDTLKSIAKKYGFGDEKMVWDYPENRDLKKLRKDPKEIQPGDIVAIPPMNDDERAEYSENLKNFANAAAAEQLAYNRFRERFEADRALADKLEKLIGPYEAASAAYIKQYENTVKTAKSWSDGVDAAKAVIDLVKSMGAIAMKGIKSTEALVKKADDEYTALNKEILSDAGEMAVEPLVSEGTKQAAKSLSDTKTGNWIVVKSCVGSILQSYDKWSSPSFYGQTIALLAEGKGWTKAATFDLEDDCKTTMDRMAAERSTTLTMLKEKAAKIRASANSFKKASDAALKRRDEFQKKARDL